MVAQKFGPNSLYWLMVQTGKICPYVEGGPGIAKSMTARAFARCMGRNCYVFVGSLRDPADIGGYPYPYQFEVDLPDGTKRTVSYMAIMPAKWASDTEDGLWLLFFDELPSCAPAVQTAMMGVIAERRVGDYYLPPVWMCAAGNPVEQAANGYGLEPPLANRMPHLEWEIDRAAIEMGFANGFQFPEPTFPRLPDDWENHLGEAGGRVAGFLNKNPDLLYAYPKDRSAASGAWPSPRTWEMAGIARAALMAVDAPKEMFYQADRACVGDGAASQKKTWEDKLDLPDPEKLLAEAIVARSEGREPQIDLPKRSDQVIVTLSAVISRAVNHERDASGRPRPDRWLGAADVLTVALENYAELVVATGGTLFNHEPLGNPLIPAKLIDTLTPILKATRRI